MKTNVMPNTLLAFKVLVVGVVALTAGVGAVAFAQTDDVEVEVLQERILSMQGGFVELKAQIDAGKITLEEAWAEWEEQLEILKADKEQVFSEKKRDMGERIDRFENERGSEEGGMMRERFEKSEERRAEMKNMMQKGEMEPSEMKSQFQKGFSQETPGDGEMMQERQAEMQDRAEEAGFVRPEGGPTDEQRAEMMEQMDGEGFEGGGRMGGGGGQR